MTLRLRVAPSLAALDAAQWDACANPHAAPEIKTLHGETDSPSQPSLPQPEARGERFNPFITHDFLSALEKSGSVGPGTGWSPAHLVVEDESGMLQAAAPCYLKNHSQGEYVFDHGWAQAYQRAGGRYYPKLQVSVPFTPVTGRRILARSDAANDMLIAGLKSLQNTLQASSTHLTFLTKNQSQQLEQAGYLLRTDQQFHFFNESYAGFEDFLAALSSKKRKNIRRERRDALAPGIVVEQRSGSQIRPEHWDAFFEFYLETGARKWGRPYLTRGFFEEIGHSLSRHILLVLAKRDNRYIAGAINFIGQDALYGRNWGAIEHHPFLHFELCYYQAIDFALAHGLARVEAGAQGEHKLARGYKPVITHSAHDFADPALRRAVATYLQQERHEIAEFVSALGEHVPFRHKSAAQAGPEAERDLYDE